MSHKGLAINFSDRCCSIANDVVSKAAFGKKCKDQKELLPLLNKSIKLTSGFDIPDLFPSLGFLGFVTESIPSTKDMQSKLSMILESICSTTTAGNDKADEEAEGNFVDVLLKLNVSNKVKFNFTTNLIKDIIMVGKLRQTVSEGDTVVVGDGITGTVVEVPFLAGQHPPSESSSS